MVLMNMHGVVRGLKTYGHIDELLEKGQKSKQIDKLYTKQHRVT